MPTAKLAAYAQLAEETAGRITHSHQEWTGFLQTAARLYKYPYHEQLMIYAQRPEATACAEYEIWNKAMRRYVRRGSRGIALIDTASDMPKLRYVFDIADTGGRENSRRPFLWELTEQNTPAAMNALENGYDVPASEGLERQLHAIASELSQVYWIDHQGEILDIVDGSYLEGYDEFNVGASFRKAVSVSLEYALLSRCGLSPDERFIHEDFLPMDELYMAGQQERRVLAQDLLYLRRDFSEEGRKPGFLQTLDAYNEIGFPEGVEKLGGALEQAEFRHTLKKELEALAQGYSQNPNLLSYRNHQPVRLLERLGELDWPRKEYESTLLESSALQGFITRDETDAELARGSGIENGRSRIASFFSQAHTDKEKADFLKNEYGIGGHSHALSGVSGSHEEHDAKGIRLQKPGCADVLLKWPEVARRIDALIAQRRYLPEKEKAVPSRTAITKEDIQSKVLQADTHGKPRSS